MSNSRYLFLGLVLITVFVLVLRSFNWAGNQSEISFSEFLARLDSGQINKVVVSGNTIKGEYRDQTSFTTRAPIDAMLSSTPNNVVSKMVDKNVNLSVQQSSGNSWYWVLLINWGPFIFLIAVWIYLFRKGVSKSNIDIFSVGKSKARQALSGDRLITFKDVAGIEESKKDLSEVVDFLKNPTQFSKLGGRIPKGILMVGPPGTGKTMLAKAVAGEAQVPFFSISGSDFVEMFVGVGASRVRDLFEEASNSAPCIIFIDEIDAVGRHRGAGLGGGHDEREQTLNQLLVEMDGFDAHSGVIVVAATNRADILDPALLRPGRFDRRIEVPLPDIKGRKQILEVHCKNVKMDEEVDLEVIAKGTVGFSGAELANLINEAALHSAKHDLKKVNNAALEWAKDKLTMGVERKSFKMIKDEKKITAYHEAGHAIVSAYVEKSDPIHKITIIPRGMALGVTSFLPEKDKVSLDKSEIMSKITVSMGGRAAEEIFCKDITNGAENDFKYSTNLAYKMVCEWGMSDKLGPLAVKSNEGSFLAMDYFQDESFSDETREVVDEEVKNVLNSCYNNAKNILSKNVKKVEALVKALLEKETISKEEFLAIVAK